MNWIEKMIAEQCPQGVKKEKLGEVGTFYNGVTGKNKNDFVDGNATFITYMNVYSNPSLKTDVEDKVVIAEGEKQNIIEYGDCLFTTSSETPKECGMSSVLTHHPKTKLYLNSFCFGYRFNDLSCICPAFFSHLFRSNALRIAISETANGVTRFNVSKKLFAKIEIPLPPLSIQEEIVEVLDKFTELIKQTDEEIELRQKQYEYYREKLLTFEEGEAEWKKLGDCSSIKKGTYITKKDSNSGVYPVVLGGQEPGYYIDKYNHEGEAIVVSRSGASAGFVSFWNEPIFVSDGFYIESVDNNLRYLYLYLKLKQDNINEMKRGAGVPHITTGHLENLVIPIPPLSRQQEIVVTLDKFEALIASLKEERELRQKQYEYYREKLLTF